MYKVKQTEYTWKSQLKSEKNVMEMDVREANKRFNWIKKRNYKIKFTKLCK